MSLSSAEYMKCHGLVHHIKDAARCGERAAVKWLICALCGLFRRPC
jgi:hypothetical protein